MAKQPETLHVELVYALPEEQVVTSLQVPLGTRVREAIARTDLLARFPELDAATVPVGIFGQCVPLDHVLRAGDRIEIYRPLPTDPKLARRARVERQRRGGSRNAE